MARAKRPGPSRRSPRRRIRTRARPPARAPRDPPRSGARDVEAVVHAVDEEDVRVPLLPEQSTCARGEPDARVAREVAGAAVRLGLDDCAISAAVAGPPSWTTRQPTRLRARRRSARVPRPRQARSAKALECQVEDACARATSRGRAPSPWKQAAQALSLVPRTGALGARALRARALENRHVRRVRDQRRGTSRNFTRAGSRAPSPSRTDWRTFFEGRGAAPGSRTASLSASPRPSGSIARR